MADAGVAMIARGDIDYPPLLATIPDPPFAVWVRGELEEGDQLAVAMVGSRRCTAYGRDQAGRLGALLAQSGLAIVSGGARGIDAEAHRAALRVGGRTVAVCGCGLSEVYPPEHAELFDRIAAGQGAVISEYPMTTPPRAEHFPRRNRIISGMSLGVLVIEAGQRSGALITARLAAEEHNREVMALPGRVDSPASLGCLRAIRDGWAAMVLDHADIITQLESSQHILTGAIERAYESEQSTGGATVFELQVTDTQRAIIDALRSLDGSASLDQLVSTSQMSAQAIMADLTLLQIQKVIRRDAGGIHLRERGGSDAAD